MNSVLSRDVVHSSHALQLSWGEKRCCLAETALSGENAINDANVDVLAGRMPQR